MLINIKSLFIMKKVFLLLSSCRKLKLIKCNKSLRDKLNINISDYRIYSRRYIEYEENGIGKEYDFLNGLIYVGEYSKGKRSGKGKEYNYDGELIYKGKYFNGKRNGKGIEYNNIILKVEYLNGKKHGKVKEFYENRKIKFKGEYLY